ncbi:MAG: hypothetical protein M1151_05415 [Candidatus Thermoplasmatota archaeon]|nr:hypothetical protein [Candidatus Thermoplasmatota archaeon]
MSKKQKNSNSKMRKKSQSKRKSPSSFQRKVMVPFRLKLKHVLGGVSLVSLLAAFEVLSIPVASGIIDLYSLSSMSAAEVWFGTAFVTGFAAVYLHREEQESDL